jgi:hypothetical protein
VCTESTQALSLIEPTVGGTRPADHLAERTGLDVAWADVELLVERRPNSAVGGCMLVISERRSSMAGNVHPQTPFSGDRISS